MFGKVRIAPPPPASPFVALPLDAARAPPIAWDPLPLAASRLFVWRLLCRPRVAPRDPMWQGVYFADMVTKSANYCFANRQNPTGVLMLCDVALGKQYERLTSEYEAVIKGLAEPTLRPIRPRGPSTPPRLLLISLSLAAPTP
eukprot:2490230-Prymnesium_polylepis.1